MANKAKKKRNLLPLTIIFLILISSCSGTQMEKGSSPSDPYSDEMKAALGRGIVSYHKDRHHVQLSWRILPEDRGDLSFDIYRKNMEDPDEKFRWIARTDQSSYIDRDAQGKRHVYAVRTRQDGMQGPFSRESLALTSVRGKAALIFDIGHPYKQARVVTGDLNGDGEPEIVVAYSRFMNVDPYEKAWSKSEDTFKIAAFLADGKRLWTYDLGWGIEAGMNYQPMVVWDLDADGRAEVILKTNKSGDPLDYEGERITVLDGMTAQIKKEAKWPSLFGRKKTGPIGASPLDQNISSDYSNDSRNYLAIAHLDGKDPYIIAARGTYRIQTIWAFDKNLEKVWERNLGLDLYYPSALWDRLVKFWNINDKMEWIWARLKSKPVKDRYRGSHSLPVADINEDGKEEILWGERCIGEKGKDLWAIEENMPYLGHPDIVFPADILPSHKGKEVFYGREGWEEKNEKIGVYLVDYQGKILWANWGYHHIDRGWAGKIMADQEGMQCLAIDIEEKQWDQTGAKLIEPKAFFWASDGKLLGSPPASLYYSFPVDWDGDGVREICVMEEGNVKKYGGSVVEKISANCLWGADLFGDHREEIVAAPGDGKIYIYFNTDITDNSPRVTPMADRQYRNDLSRTAMHENVIPTEGGVIPRRSKR